jgi:hypothetical protein
MIHEFVGLYLWHFVLSGVDRICFSCDDCGLTGDALLKCRGSNAWVHRRGTAPYGCPLLGWVQFDILRPFVHARCFTKLHTFSCRSEHKTREERLTDLKNGDNISGTGPSNLGTACGRGRCNGRESYGIEL